MRPAPPLRRIAILGGTHGNETNGVFVVEGFRRGGGKEPMRPSFSEVQLHISNPGATNQVTRFVTEDLNRQFRLDWLRDHSRGHYEAQRAKVLNQVLGPKPGSADAVCAPLPREDPDCPEQNGACDFLIDYHTTCGNMGCCLIVTGKDRISLNAASYARAWLDSQGMPCTIFHIGIDRAEQPWIASAGRHGVIVECGPSPWGVVRHDIVAWMRESTRRMLDYIDAHNRGAAAPMPPAGTWGKKWAVGTDTISGPAPLPAKVVLNKAVIDSATNMPAKIPVPADEHGRALVMFHPDLQDHDWRSLRKGDPMFVGFDGEVITYDGRFGDVFAHFVNEAAYFLPSSGLGFELSQEVECALQPPLPVAPAAAL
eukprot:TRINITY_DN5193_c0_g1_i1.p1 TRINITY_DN5193_c0_g1~~TRINITY_DN5193_c0_g1_i1.p1  ORF type:complete len:404 (+),score=121.02 TRINITY_DN5193_c0_g1_i1:107-1213(+)